MKPHTPLLTATLAVALILTPSGLAQTTCGDGEVTTHYNAGNGFAGNMFDLDVYADMTIECLDISWSHAEGIDVEVWYCPATVVGNDKNQLGNWTLLGTVAGLQAAGNPNPTRVDLSGNGVVFSAGQSYGIAVFVTNYYSIAGELQYTNGAALGEPAFFGDHCVMRTYYGKGVDFAADTFEPREFNGAVYTQAVGAWPTVQVSNMVAGQTGTIELIGGTPNGRANVAWGGRSSASATPWGTLYLGPRHNPVGLRSLDANGDASWSVPVGANAAGLTLYLQGLDVAPGLVFTLTAPIAFTIQ